MHWQHQPIDAFFIFLTTQNCGNRPKVEDSSYQAPKLPLHLTPGWARLSHRSSPLSQTGTPKNIQVVKDSPKFFGGKKTLKKVFYVPPIQHGWGFSCRAFLLLVPWPSHPETPIGPREMAKVQAGVQTSSYPIPHVLLTMNTMLTLHHEVESIFPPLTLGRTLGHRIRMWYCITFEPGS